MTLKIKIIGQGQRLRLNLGGVSKIGGRSELDPPSKAVISRVVFIESG